MITLPKYFTIEDTRVAGIYFLLKEGIVVYIGKTFNLFNRLGTHHCRGKYDSIRLIQCDESLLLQYEKRWIIKFKPKYNHVHLFTWTGSNFGRRKWLRISDIKQHA